MNIHFVHRAFPWWQLINEIKKLAAVVSLWVHLLCSCVPSSVLGAGEQQGFESEQRGGWGKGRAHIWVVGPRLRTSAQWRLGQEGWGAVLAQEEKNAFVSFSPREHQVREPCVAEIMVYSGTWRPSGLLSQCHTAVGGLYHFYKRTWVIAQPLAPK